MGLCETVTSVGALVPNPVLSSEDSQTNKRTKCVYIYLYLFENANQISLGRGNCVLK